MKPSLIIRKARAGEGRSLTELAIRSKASWGYTSQFMELFAPELEIKESYLSQAAVFVAEEGGRLIGFSGLSIPEVEPELVFLFVDPEEMGRGLGQKLWETSLEGARVLGWAQFKIISDPNAEPFYLKQGAIRVGEHEFALIPRRKVPILIFNLEK